MSTTWFSGSSSAHVLVYHMLVGFGSIIPATDHVHQFLHHPFQVLFFTATVSNSCPPTQNAHLMESSLSCPNVDLHLPLPLMFFHVPQYLCRRFQPESRNLHTPLTDAPCKRERALHTSRDGLSSHMGHSPKQSGHNPPVNIPAVHDVHNVFRSCHVTCRLDVHTGNTHRRSPLAPVPDILSVFLPFSMFL